MTSGRARRARRAGEVLVRRYALKYGLEDVVVVFTLYRGARAASHGSIHAVHILKRAFYYTVNGFAVCTLPQPSGTMSDAYLL